MARTYRRWTSGALIVCLIGTWTGTLLAKDEPNISPAPSTIFANPAMSVSFARQPDSGAGLSEAVARLRFTPVESAAARSRYWGRGRRYGRDHGAARAAVVLGAVAAITGTALLVYANRPECGTNQFAGGCGYGMKVAGGAVLSAGIVGVFAGALTW